jgi:hypothetical protein
MTVAVASCTGIGLSLWRIAGVLLAAGMLQALTETRAAAICGEVHPLMDAAHLVEGLLAIGVVFQAVNRLANIPWPRFMGAYGLVRGAVRYMP